MHLPSLRACFYCSDREIVERSEEVWSKAEYRRVVCSNFDQFAFGNLTILEPITISKLPGRESRDVNQSAGDLLTCCETFFVTILIAELVCVSKGWVNIPKQMNFRKSSEGAGVILIFLHISLQ